MKIIDKVKECIGSNVRFVSFEFFPPKTFPAAENLTLRIDQMGELNPIFIDITWNDRSKRLSLDLCKKVLQYCGVEVMLHLTCSSCSKKELMDILQEAKQAGIKNIMALKGQMSSRIQKKQDADVDNEYLPYACDLVKFIRDNFGDYFCIGVAGYPEGHQTTGRGSEEYKQELQYLKLKINNGADFIITQLFYDPQVYIEYVNDCRACDISVPIIPGIMPIQTYSNFTRMVKTFKLKVPDELFTQLEAIKSNDDAVRQCGINIACDICLKLIAAGAPGIHFYTLNLERSVRKVIKMVEEKAALSSKPLPWRPSAQPKRAAEDVRPIFWANRPKSYLERTEDWDEYPNGRWGDSNSPAFGNLSGTHFYKRLGKADEKKAMWGETFLNEREVYQVFAHYIEGKVPRLPWSETGIHLETNPIKPYLIKLNSNGILTINSQPRINACSSSDENFGWGPPNGYVYQKAYIEFFASEKILKILISLIDGNKKYSSLTYHAVNFQNESHSNSISALPCAVTWGVFPDREVQQPTVVDPQSFMVWKEEAFDLWISEWANIYDEDSSAYEVLYDIHDTYFLINIVDNNFIDGNIFAIFDEILLQISANGTTAEDV